MVMEEQESDMELASERVPVPQVQKPVEKCHVEPTNKVTSSSRGKPRYRKKALHAAILKQMEFYFSDANLAKDRFLRNLIEEDPYVDLNIFISFNKIRELTTDSNRIAKALSTSTVLQLSEDGTKVQRVTPITQKENIDDCTIYVQNLQPDADHEMLNSIFSQYGEVVYVSVPKYKSNKKIKGFAFIEFDKPEYAQKCLKSFQKKGCVLPSTTSPNDLLSITTFDNTEKDVTQYGRMGACGEGDDQYAEVANQLEPTATGNIPENSEDTEEDKSAKKSRKRKHTENSVTEAVDSELHGCAEGKSEAGNKQKKKCESAESIGASEDLLLNNKNQTASTAESSEEPETNKHRSSKVEGENNASDNAHPSNNENQEVEDTDMVSDSNEGKLRSTDKKKKRKRKRNTKVEDVCYIMGLQVMTKKDWKVLRNKYLDLQRSKMKQLKHHLKKTRWNQWSNLGKFKQEKEDNTEKEKAAKQDASGGERYTFTPGVIVKVDLDKPCTDPKNFKMELRGNNVVKYIDIDEGSFHAYIRCDTAEGAQSFAQKSTEEQQMSILQGEEEKMYWDKIAQDREEKLGKKVRVKQRGRNKLLKKAEKELGKHIKFDDEV